MSKISTYPSADTPLLLSDRLIGTEAIRTPPSLTPLATKNFSLGDLLNLFSSNFPAATLQAVLNAGNIATQNITLTGTISATLIKPINIEDTSGSQGLTFQVLSKGASSINWNDIPVDNLQAVLNAGNTATQNITLVGDITSTNIIPGNIKDETGSYGTAGKVLSKTATGIRWINNPTVTTPGLADVLSVGNTATNTIILNEPPSIDTISNTIYGGGMAPSAFNILETYNADYNFFSFSLEFTDAIAQNSINGYGGTLQLYSTGISDSNKNGGASLQATDNLGSSYLQLINKLGYEGVLKVTNLSRHIILQFPNKATGTYTIATTEDILLTEQTIDSYIGSRLKPINPLSNGFYVDRNVNGAIGFSAINTNTGNGAVSVLGTGIGGLYTQSTYIAKFGPNYYVPLLAGKGGLLGTEEVFVGSTDGSDVSILTGTTFTSISRKLTVKANGQLLLQTTPTTGTTSDKLLVRDISGNIKQIDYPNVLGYNPYRFINTANAVNVTGTTSETTLLTITIPPNSFASNDVINIPFLSIVKIGTAGNCNIRLRVSSTNLMSTATQIALYTASTTEINTTISRHYSLNGGFLKGLNATTSVVNDIIANGTSQVSTAFDTTITQYLFITVANGSIADSTSLMGVNITN